MRLRGRLALAPRLLLVLLHITRPTHHPPWQRLKVCLSFLVALHPSVRPPANPASPPLSQRSCHLPHLVSRQRQLTVDHDNHTAAKIGLTLLQNEKPRSSITALLDILTLERYEEDDYEGITELVEAINVQQTGPSEASRAIRKKVGTFGCAVKHWMGVQSRWRLS